MIIGTIVNGVVIDHIPAGRGMELYHYLKLDGRECEVALIQNAVSAKHGKKDIIKVNEEIDLDFDILGFIAPEITVNIIENSVLVRKMHPELPNTLTNVIRCRNPRCITSSERELPQRFHMTDRSGAVYRCVYCDTIAERGSLV